MRVSLQLFHFLYRFHNRSSLLTTSLFIKGMIVGFSLAAPVGPIGFLCIRRTLAENHFIGLMVGLGAAVADAMFGGVAAFGLTFVSSLLISQLFWLRLVGGSFLCYLGYKTLKAHPAPSATPPNNNGLCGAFLWTFFLTLTNPLTVLAFASIFAVLGIGDESFSYLSAAKIVTGVFTGSALWFLFLSMGAHLFRPLFSENSMRWVNRISGTVICGFGLIALISIL